jgi:hypothetical protein
MPAQLVCVRTGLFAALGIAIAATAGCKQPPTPCFPVSGKVVYQKKPVTTGTVTFVPDASKGNQSKESAIGLIKDDGTYSLVTNGRDGAPLGWYKVGISTMAPPMGDMAPPEIKPGSKAAPKGSGKAPGVPPKFQHPDTSGVSIEVKENAPPGAYDIELK